jgi:putative transposase
MNIITSPILPKSCLSVSTSPKKLYDYGMKKEKLEQQKQMEDIEDISMTQKQVSKKSKKKQSFMQELVPPNNEEILKTKSKSSKKPSQVMKSLQISVQDSILKEKVFKPFWNSHLEETYKKLWLPIETDFQDLDLNSLNISLKNITSISKSSTINLQKSQSQSWQKTCCLSSQSLQQDTMVQENIRFCRKIRIYPNKEQKELFQQCLGAYRYFFNKTNCHLKNLFKQKQKVVLKLEAIRSQVMKRDRDLREDDLELWQKEVPYDTRQEAIDDAIVSWKTAFKKLKAKQITTFDISYKNKKATSQIFRVNKKALKIKERIIFIQRLKKKGKLRIRKRDIEEFYNNDTLNGNFIILKTKPNYWYICLPRERTKAVFENQCYKSVFLDPGVRSFQTFYSPEGICGKIKVNQKLYSKVSKHDILHSILSSKVNTKTKYNIKERMAKLRFEMKNIINDMHWKTCSFLCSNFKEITIPFFDVSNMVKDSPLGSKVTRKILGLSHGEFKERLKWYCQVKDVSLQFVTEEYTTQTCGNCGYLQKINANKIYSCKECNLSIDRDYNGARNICLKTLSG